MTRKPMQLIGLTFGLVLGIAGWAAATPSSQPASRHEVQGNYKNCLWVNPPTTTSDKATAAPDKSGTVKRDLVCQMGVTLYRYDTSGVGVGTVLRGKLVKDGRVFVKR